MAVTKGSDTGLAASVGLKDEDLVAMYRLVSLARLLEGTSGEIAMSVHAHPTLTEALAEAALAVDGAPIHV